VRNLKEREFAQSSIGDRSLVVYIVICSKKRVLKDLAKGASLGEESGAM